MKIIFSICFGNLYTKISPLFLVNIVGVLSQTVKLKVKMVTGIRITAIKRFSISLSGT